MLGHRFRSTNGLFAVATVGLIAACAGIGWLLDPARREAATLMTEARTQAAPLAPGSRPNSNTGYLDLVSFRRRDGDVAARIADLAQAAAEPADAAAVDATGEAVPTPEQSSDATQPSTESADAAEAIRLPSTTQETGATPPVPDEDAALPAEGKEPAATGPGNGTQPDSSNADSTETDAPSLDTRATDAATDAATDEVSTGADGEETADSEDSEEDADSAADEQLPPVDGDAVRVTLNFQDAPWDIVLKRLAEEAGYAVQLDVLPPGSFTYLSSKPMTIAEAIDLFNGYLYSSGHLIIRKQNLITVVKTEEPIPSHLIPLISPADLGSYGRNELLSMEVPLNTIDPVAAAAEVNGLLSPLGRAVPLPSAQRIVVTDFGQNLRQLYEMLWSRESDPLNPPQVVFKLKNSKAEDVAKAINEYFATQRASFGGSVQSSRPALAAGQVGPGIQAGATASTGDGLVIAEPTSNSILVNATTLQMEKIRQIIEELDCIPPQIVIQALLVEVDLGSVDELGVELGVQDSVLFDRSVVDNLVTVTETVSNPATGIATTNQSIISQTADPGFNFNNKPLGNNIAAHPSKVGSQGLANFAVGRVNGDLGYGGLVLSAGSESISALLRALSARRKVDILSRPQVRTLENQPAEIQIGQQVPVVDGVSVTPVGSANPVIRQDQAGLILKVVPRVSEFDEVVIEVEAEKSEFNTTRGSGIPIFTDATTGNVIEAPIKNVSKATTMVSCMAGQTIILGGMISKGTNVVERKVPLLGDIPVVGWLFRYDYEQVGRKELLIFLTPQVIRSPRESDVQTAKEASRMHLPVEDANQIHGPHPVAPEKFQPRGMKYPEWPWFHRKKKSEVVIEEAPVVSDLFPSDAYPMGGVVAEPLMGPAGEVPGAVGVEALDGAVPGEDERRPASGEELPVQPFVEKRGLELTRPGVTR